MTKEEMFYLLRGDNRLENCLRVVLKEKEAWLIPNLDFGERLQFTKEGVQVIKFYSGSGGKNCIEEGKTLLYSESRFKMAFNEAIDLSIEQLKKIKI